MSLKSIFEVISAAFDPAAEQLVVFGHFLFAHAHFQHFTITNWVFATLLMILEISRKVQIHSYAEIVFGTQDHSLLSDFVTAHLHQRHHVNSMHTLETPLLVLKIMMRCFDH